MKRRAILIGYPGERGDQDYCEGVLKDMTNMGRFLISPQGGMWYPNEIASLTSPLKEVVRRAIAELGRYDYSLILFSGHGYHSQARGSTTIVSLNKDEEMDSVEFRTNRSSRHTLMLDCCRKEGESTFFGFKESVKIAKQIDGDACRRYYDDWVMKCEPMMIVMNSCSIGEYSYDDANRGGYYTHSLIDVANEWSRSTSLQYGQHEILSNVTAHVEAFQRVTQKSGGSQHPSIEKPKSIGNVLPMAVSA